MSETHVILGAGQAGAWAAVAMRRAGFAGRIVLIGAEPHLPYERPPLSKAWLTAETEPEPSWFHPAARYAELDISLWLDSPAMALDLAERRVGLADGREIRFDRLLIATGGRARRLAVPGGERALVLRDIADARAIRARLETARRVVCIGAGVIGLEAAASARTRGAAVTVLEAALVAMGRAVAPEVAGFICDLHRAAGVALEFGVSVTGIEADAVTCADGRAFPADLVLAGVGMQRETALAEAAGLAVDNGVVVDALTATAVPGVFAAGDVAAFPHRLVPDGLLRLETWRHAQNHGTAAGQAMAGAGRPYDEVPWFWTDQYGVNLQVGGLPALASRTLLRVAEPRRLVALHLDAAGRVVGASAAEAPREMRPAMRLIQSGAVVDPARLADPSVPLGSG
ncbi:MAG: NAD(P)/FAD-dependent oxidoreductase [Acetobacteraceae bacterium]